MGRWRYTWLSGPVKSKRLSIIVTLLNPKRKILNFIKNKFKINKILILNIWNKFKNLVVLFNKIKKNKKVY